MWRWSLCVALSHLLGGVHGATRVAAFVDTCDVCFDGMECAAVVSLASAKGWRVLYRCEGTLRDPSIGRL